MIGVSVWWVDYIWHHKTFLVQLYWHLAIQLYCCISGYISSSLFPCLYRALYIHKIFQKSAEQFPTITRPKTDYTTNSNRLKQTREQRSMPVSGSLQDQCDTTVPQLSDPVWPEHHRNCVTFQRSERQDESSETGWSLSTTVSLTQSRDMRVSIDTLEPNLNRTRSETSAVHIYTLRCTQGFG